MYMCIYSHVYIYIYITASNTYRLVQQYLQLMITATLQTGTTATATNNKDNDIINNHDNISRSLVSLGKC